MVNAVDLPRFGNEDLSISPFVMPGQAFGPPPSTQPISNPTPEPQITPGSPAQEKRWAKIKSAVKKPFEWIERQYKKYVAPVTDRIAWVGRVTSKVSALGSNFYNVISEFVLPLLGIVRFTSEAASDALPEDSKYMIWIRRFKVLSAFTLPVSVVEVALGVYHVGKAIFAQKDWSTAADEAIGVVEKISSISDNVATVIWGIQEFGLLTQAGVSIAATCLSGVGSVLSAASIALSLKHMVEGLVFYTRLRSRFRNFKENPESFKNGVEFIEGKRNSGLQRNLGVGDGAKFKTRMKAIWEHYENDKHSEQSKKNLQKAMNAFTWHTVLRTLNHTLAITAGVVSIVATAILIFTPLAPLGYAMIAAAAAIGIYVLISGKISTFCFEHRIKGLASYVDLPELPRHTQTETPRPDMYKLSVQPAV